MVSKAPDHEGPVEIPEVVSILPLRNSTLFPGSIIPIDVGRKKSVKLIEDAISRERPVIGIVTQRDARTEDPALSDMYQIGCAARILKVIKLAKDNFSVILQGISRIRVEGLEDDGSFLTARVRSLPDRPDSSDADAEQAASDAEGAESSDEMADLVENLKEVAKRVIKLMPELPKKPPRWSTVSPNPVS